MTKSPEFSDKIPDLIKELAEAFSAHNRISNRLWVLAATLTLFVVGSYETPVGENIKFLGFEMTRTGFFPISAFLLVIVNIAYCSAHVQGYRVGDAFKNVVNRYDPEDLKNPENVKLLADSLRLKTASYMLMMPNYNRIHPIFIGLTPDGQALWYRALKMLVDLAFLAIPLIGVFAAISVSEKNTIFYFTTALLPLSLFSSGVLALKAFDWSIFSER